MQLIDWALQSDLPAAEKLILTYLANRSNDVGVGAWDPDRLVTDLGVNRRSLQRWVKALRDAELLVTGDGWFQLLPLRLEALELRQKVQHQIAALPADMRPVMPGEDPPLPEIDADAIGETIANHVADACGAFLDQLFNFELRLRSQFEQLALASNVEHFAPPLRVPPPPDPVRTSEIYSALLLTGIAEEKAYIAAKAILNSQPDPEPPEKPQAASNGSGGPVPDRHYPDTSDGRLQRVADILAGTVDTDIPDEARFAWYALETEENKHTVKGEVDAAELLYPAIVQAARQNVSMRLETFLDPAAIKRNRAPWDMGPANSPVEDAVLEAEIGQMVAELARVADKRCTVQGRTQEIGPDGKTYRETILAYHRRVTGIYRQYQHLKETGAL